MVTTTMRLVSNLFMIVTTHRMISPGCYHLNVFLLLFVFCLFVCLFGS